MDPWFSPKGAYYSGWYQWPPNQYILENIILRTQYTLCLQFMIYGDTDLRTGVSRTKLDVEADFEGRLAATPAKR